MNKPNFCLKLSHHFWQMVFQIIYTEFLAVEMHIMFRCLIAACAATERITVQFALILCFLIWF